MEYIQYLIYPNKILAQIMQNTSIAKLTFAKLIIVILVIILILGIIKDFIRKKAQQEIFKKYPLMESNNIPIKEQLIHFGKWWLGFWLIFSIIAIPAAKIETCTYEINFNQNSIETLKTEKELKCTDYWTRDNNWTNFETNYIFLGEQIYGKDIFYSKIKNDLEGKDNSMSLISVSDNLTLNNNVQINVSEK